MKKILLLSVMMFAMVGFTMAQGKTRGHHHSHHKVHHHHPHHRPHHK